MSTRTKLARVAGNRPAYQPVGLSMAAEPGVYANRNAVVINVARIRPNPRNPRKVFSAEALNELAASIQTEGILNPITVRREDDHYVIVAGDRRYRAALQVGLAEVPCIVVDITAEDAYVASLIENLQREDLLPDEEAAALGYLLSERGMGVREIARLIHKSPYYVSTKVRVAQDPELLEAIKDGLPMTAAEKLVTVREPERRQEIIEGFQRGTIKTQDLRSLLRPKPTPQSEQPPGQESEVLDNLTPASVASGERSITRHAPRTTPSSVESHATPPAGKAPPATEDAPGGALEQLLAEFTALGARARAELERALAAGQRPPVASLASLRDELAAWQRLLASLDGALSAMDHDRH